VKQGLAYARKNKKDILYLEGNAGNSYGISVSAILKTAEDGVSSYYQVGYTFRKPTDQYSHRIGRGVSAYRVMDGVTHPYQFRIGLKSPGSIKPRRLCAVISAHIMMDVLSARIAIPSRVGADLLKYPMIFLYNPEDIRVPQRIVEGQVR